MKMEEAEQIVNGIENVNFDDDDQEKNYRPPDIDADVRDMERRKRVEAMMASRVFKEELERIVEQHSTGGSTLATAQHLNEIFGSTSRVKTGAIIPINDIKGPESLFYVKGEKLLRCKLAALYRLVDLHGWTQSIYNHITVRINQDQEHFLINPFGLLYHEVTASSLVKVDMQGNIVDPGSTNFSVNVAGFMLHSAIHQARPDVRCVIHMHLPAVVAVSAMKCGLLPLSQEACIIGPVSYHPFEGILVDAGERVRIAENLGPNNKVMLLRNHGFVACGETIEEAWALAYHTVLACEAQMKMLPIGIENLVLISEDAIRRTAEAVRAGVASKSEAAGVQATHAVSADDSDLSVKEDGGAQKPAKREKKWRVGEMEFEAYMRMLDNAGYRTGYMYRQPIVKNEAPRQKLDIEVPPAVSSFGYQIEGEEMYRDLIKRLLEGKKSSERAKWINSPNVYQKVEILETGTHDPKKITKWVADSSPTHSTPVKVDPALQFVPVGTNPKEFKEKQKAIKEHRRAGGVSAGPQSHILEGVSWDEARKMQEAQMNGDQVVLVGAASKGIIQRDFQHHALVYKTPYAKNPFDNISSEEIDNYKKEIERNQRGGIMEDGEHVDHHGEHDESFVSTNLSSISAPQQMTAESVTLPETPHPEDVTLSPPQSPPPAASDLEDEGLSSHQVLMVEANTLPRASRAERQTLPEHGPEMPAPHVERSKSARFPRDQAPGITNSPSRSFSLNRGIKKNKDTVNGDDVDNPQSVSSSRDNSAAHDVSEGSPVAGKKKKKGGLSFLKMKSNKKKEAAAAQ